MLISLIIPVYNEERHIRGCLEAIAKQTVKPEEVIVVDNNCTDGTIAVAREFPFVTVVAEKNQGRGPARSRGFDAARGDILGRIDADSRLREDWVETVLQRFGSDADLEGLTGLAYTDIVPFLHSPKSTLPSRAYFWFAHAGFNTVTMWGANMAIRKNAWDVVRNKVCMDDRVVHEDQDVSLWMAARGMKIRVDNGLRIITNGQTYRYFPKLLHYSRLFVSTKSYHRRNGNLKSPDMPRLGFWRTLPGRIYASLASIYMLLASLVPFPIDYVAVRIVGEKRWFA